MYSSTWCCRSVRPCMHASLLNMCARVKQRADGLVSCSARSDLPQGVEDLSLEGIGVARLAAVLLLVRPFELLFVVGSHERGEGLLVGAHEELLLALVARIAEERAAALRAEVANEMR